MLGYIEIVDLGGSTIRANANVYVREDNITFTIPNFGQYFKICKTVGNIVTRSGVGTVGIRIIPSSKDMQHYEVWETRFDEYGNILHNVPHEQDLDYSRFYAIRSFIEKNLECTKR